MSISILNQSTTAPNVLHTNSRFNIISWINDTLLLPLTRIQQLGAGNVYCQILDAAYPERVPIHKVKWDAKLQIDFLHNFKILQNSFQYLGIEKKIDISQIQKLAKAKYQDNLEFVQWLKSFVEDKIDYVNYQPLKRRNYAKLFLGFLDKKKFNVTLAGTGANTSMNKQNLDTSFGYMRSSIKSNATMKSMVSSRSSVLSVHMTNNNSKNTTVQKVNNKKQRQKQKQNLTKIVQKRRTNVGPISFVAPNQKPLYKNQSVTALGGGQPKCKSKIVPLSINKNDNNLVKNVEAIQSEGQEDQFF